MAARPIVIYGDPVLREVSTPVDNVDQSVRDLVTDMIDTLREAKGLGLAAVQVGVLRRVFILDLAAVDITASIQVFINPEILEVSEEDIEYEEGCLSFPGIYQKITRPARIRVRAMDADGKEFEMDVSGMTARAVLHEFDHLEGKLFIDRMSPMAKTLLRGRLKKLAKAS